MANFVFAYTGGSMAATEEEQQAVMAAWIGWFGSLGDTLVDGGNPFAASTTVGSDGSVNSGGTSGLTGYSVVSADNLDAATKLAADCPVLTSGGSVEVYEALPM